MPSGLPSIFLMDCTLNDCGADVKLINKVSCSVVVYLQCN